MVLPTGKCLVEPSEALERYRCLLYCVRSSKSNSTGSVLQKVFATGCQIRQKTGQQSMVIFYRSGFTELGDGPNTKNVPNRCAYSQKNLQDVSTTETILKSCRKKSTDCR